MQMRYFFAGLLIGALTGATAMLLLAPKSGKRMRAQLQHQVEDLREQMIEAVEDVEVDAMKMANKAASNARGQVKELQQRGENLFHAS